MPRRRRDWPIIFLLLPVVLANYEPQNRGYEANPIGPQVPEEHTPFLPPRAPIARGYQPPPQPALFEPPRSYYTVQHHQGRGHGHMPSMANPLPRAPTNWAQPRPLDQDLERQLLFEAERRLMTMRQQPRFDEDRFLEKAVGGGEKAPGLPVRHPEPPHRLVYTPKQAGPPASAPITVVSGQKAEKQRNRQTTRTSSFSRPSSRQQEVSAATSVDLSSLEENPPDVINNIIVHIYLNSRDKKTAHAVSKIGPIHGVFGIGTAHGGPGSHQNPIVITKEFDRDKLKFVDENTADRMMEEGPANIVEVKAMVSTPDRKIEKTLDRAVNSELERAIPIVVNRFHGSMTGMDGELRKELEQALVDEIAKNLGDTIDSMEPGEVNEEDLNKLIEEGFNEVVQGSTTLSPTTRRITVVTMSTERVTITPRPTTQRVTTTIPTIRTTTERVTTTQRPTTRTTSRITVVPTTEQWHPPTFRITTERVPTTQRGTEATVTTTERVTTSRSTTTERVAQPTTQRRTEATTRPTVVMTTQRRTESTTQRVTTTTQTPPPRTFRISTTSRPTTVSTTESTTRKVTVAATTERTRPSTEGTTRQNYIAGPVKIPTNKVTVDFNHESSVEVTEKPPVPATTSKPTLPEAGWSPAPTVSHREEPSSEEDFNIVTSRPIKVVDLSGSQEVTATVTIPVPTPETSTRPTGTVRPGVIHLVGEESEEEEEEPVKGRVKPLPQSFGEMNMMGKGQEVAQESTDQEGTVDQPTGQKEESEPPIRLEETISRPEDQGTVGQPAGQENRGQETISQPTSPEGDEESSSQEGPEESTAPLVPVEASRPTVPNREPAQTTRPTVSPHPTTVTTPKATEPFVTHEIFELTTEHPTAPPPWENIPSESEETTPAGTCLTPNDPLDRSRSDVLFLLDSSNRFTEDKFMHAITLILNTVDRLRNVGPDGVQVSLVQFNTEPYLEFSLRKHNCKQFLKDDIADTQYMTGGSMLGRALEKVMKFAFTKKRGDRPNAENILIILTDGQSEDRVQLPVQISKDHNVTVFAIGTVEANPEYLKKLSGNSENVFQLTGAANTPLAGQLADKIMRSKGPERFPEHDPEYESMETPPSNRHPVDVNDVSGDENIPPFPPTKTGLVHLECTMEGFKIQFNLPSRFEGHAVVKGKEKDPNCQVSVKPSRQTGNHTVDFLVPTDSCGVTVVESEDPSGRNSSVIVHLVHTPSLRTEEDRAFLLQCFVGSRLQKDEEVSTHLDVVKSEVTIAETISLSTLPPTCTYSIRKERPDGPVISRATVGQAVYHRWDCDGNEKANNGFGIKIHSCFASDDVEQKYPIVDGQGCSSDLALLTNIVYDEDKLSAYALSHVFGVLEHDSLKFVCKLSLCTRDGDGCEGVTPPRCGDNHTDLLVWKPVSSLNDPALTSALSTKVLIGEEPTYAKVLTAFHDSKILLALAGLMIFVAATMLVLHKLRQQQYSATSTPLSSMRSRASSHFETSSSDQSHLSGPVPDPRLLEFLKDFDRNRYV